MKVFITLRMILKDCIYLATTFMSFVHVFLLGSFFAHECPRAGNAVHD